MGETNVNKDPASDSQAQLEDTPIIDKEVGNPWQRFLELFNERMNQYDQYYVDKATRLNSMFGLPQHNNLESWLPT